MKNVMKHKEKIIYGVVGAVISTVSIYIYFNFKINMSLIIIICLIDLTYASYQFSHLYLSKKEYGLLSKMILSFFAVIIFICIVFTANILITYFLFKQTLVLNALILAFLLSPSFVVVIAATFLILLVLSYAA